VKFMRAYNLCNLRSGRDGKIRDGLESVLALKFRASTCVSLSRSDEKSIVMLFGDCGISWFYSLWNNEEDRETLRVSRSRRHR